MNDNLDSTYAATLQEREEKLRSAMISSNVEILDELLADDLLFSNHMGHVVSKKMDLDMHAAGDLHITDIQNSDQSVRYHNDLIIVSVKSKITARFQGAEANGCFRFTRVWKRSEDGQWKVIAAHASLSTE